MSTEKQMPSHTMLEHLLFPILSSSLPIVDSFLDCLTDTDLMVHYYNYEQGIQDCSRENTYHNKRFKIAAEAHGLTVEHSAKYGWSHKSPSDTLLDFILENGLTDILISRNEFA